ncbi:hypothetical protein JVT61DRAFT_15570 [Boletus reticuloceps]|uniref:Uncharacterized protein n=1 Tax=Boletus reticuloceps TaxID=495285 RepID=A0A8I3A2J5_9AGAM|nr:hypothetical protein JVT61DRAFT_15570 [Boletus reticuloceps]
MDADDRLPTIEARYPSRRATNPGHKPELASCRIYRGCQATESNNNGPQIICNTMICTEFNMRIGIPVDDAQMVHDTGNLVDIGSPTSTSYATPEPDSIQGLDMPPSPCGARDSDMSPPSPQLTPRASPGHIQSTLTPTPTPALASTILKAAGQPEDRTFKFHPQLHLHHSQVRTPAKRRAGSEGATKCRYREVDYSQSLRETLHEKDLQNTDLKTLLQDRQHEVTALHNSLKAQVQEHYAFVTQMQQDRELANQKQEEELREIKQQLEDNMRAQMDNLLEASSYKLTNALRQRDHQMGEMEQRLQSELDKRTTQMMADKERELANMEQRYTHRNRTPAQSSYSPHPATQPDVIAQIPDVAMDTEVPFVPSQNHMATEPVSRPAQAFLSTTSTQNPTVEKVVAPTPVTPSLDAIRRIKKTRAGAVSRRTRLIGVSMEEEPTAPREVPVCAENEQQQEQPNFQNMAEVIARAVEVALRNALENKNTPRPTKHSPRRKRLEDQQVALERETEPSRHRDFILGEIRRLFKDVFKISQDTDFIAHVPAPTDDVHAYEHEDGAGPTTDNLAFDLAHGSTSLWNSVTLEILLRMFQKRSSDEKWPVTKPDNYIRVELRNRYKKLRTTWLRGQPQLTQNGVLETPAELITQKHCRRTTVLDHIIKLKAEAGDDDLDTWEWLRDLIGLFGEHGMSSEESAVENDVQHVLRVKQMGWRRNIDRELDIIDTERLIGNDIFSPQGARPVKRIRASENPATSRKAVEGLPIDLYDSAWITDLTQREFDALEIPKDRFIWRRIAAA